MGVAYVNRPMDYCNNRRYICVDDTRQEAVVEVVGLCLCFGWSALLVLCRMESATMGYLRN